MLITIINAGQNIKTTTTTTKQFEYTGEQPKAGLIREQSLKEGKQMRSPLHWTGISLGGPSQSLRPTWDTVQTQGQSHWAQESQTSISRSWEERLTGDSVLSLHNSARPVTGSLQNHAHPKGGPEKSSRKQLLGGWGVEQTLQLLSGPRETETGDRIPSS